MQSPNTPTGGAGALGNQITNSILLYSNTAENSSWTSRNVTLNSYRGATFRIAFRNNSNDQFLLWIDDIIVGETSTLNNIDLPGKKNFFISQNPVKNNTLIIHSLESTNAVVYDISGKKIKSFDLVKGKNVIDIKMSKGVYVLKAQDGSSSKLIVE
ncbi:MAG: T9SS type A sorting domain-containing protein [Weeksellaceae bacterium]|nr:T9SS type A sorting domain-containing protein [Weeksellaceae bacterium]